MLECHELFKNTNRANVTSLWCCLTCGHVDLNPTLKYFSHALCYSSLGWLEQHGQSNNTFYHYPHSRSPLDIEASRHLLQCSSATVTEPFFSIKGEVIIVIYFCTFFLHQTVSQK